MTLSEHTSRSGLFEIMEMLYTPPIYFLLPFIVIRKTKNDFAKHERCDAYLPIISPEGKYESTPVWGPIDFPFRLLSIRERKLSTFFRGYNFDFRKRRLYLSSDGKFFSNPIWRAIYFLSVMTSMR